MANVKYRKDIDGLRAIAVLAVVFHHAFPSILKGGFIGVDVFFVISGYLISCIIFKNLDNHSFSLLDFYSRRIKRIFPALIIVLISCLVFGYFALLYSEYTELGKHAKAGSLFYINFELFKESGYFDKNSTLKPLLHLWSLAIEEQFYLIWPLILYLAWRLKLNKLSICILVLVISFALNIRATRIDAIAAFYLPQNRFWELMAGASLAYLFYYKSTYLEKFLLCFNKLLSISIFENCSITKNCAIVRNISSFVGFILIIIFSIFFHKTGKFPGYIALIPVLSGCFIIAAGEKALLNKYLLSNKIFVGIGLISYPLYLWHWPILSFIHIIEGHETRKWLICAALILSLLLAWATYFFIEGPIRSSKRNKIIIPSLIGAFLAIILVSNMIYSHIGVFKYLNSNYNNKAVGIYKVTPDFDKCSGLVTSYPDGWVPCFSYSSTPEFLVLGDSHAIDFGTGMILKKINSMTISSPGLPFWNYITTHTSHKTYEQNKLYSSRFKLTIDQALKINTLKYAILLSRGPLYFSGKGFGIETLDPIKNAYTILPRNKNIKITPQDAFVKGYIETIKYLQERGLKVIFVIDHHENGQNIESCAERPVKLIKDNLQKCYIDKLQVDQRMREYKELIDKIKKETPGLIIYDGGELFCDKDKCYVKAKSNEILFADDNHLSIFGAKYLVEHFFKWFESYKYEL